MIKITILLTTTILTLITNSCMVRTVTGEGGELIYQKPVTRTPWENQQKRNAEVEATEQSLGVYDR